MKKRSGQKGTFTPVELPVSRKYVFPASRRRLFWIGGIAAVAILAFVGLDQLLGRGMLVSKGPLSSNHAGFGNDCGNCHFAEGRTVADEKCSTCHEKFGDEIGVFTFASHYLYRSDDFRRLVPSEHERPCFTCHTEHEGRQAEITRVSDSHCIQCHDFGSFNERHPQFDVFTEGAPHEASLEFAHVHHVREVAKREGLEDVERACLYCHNARPDGRSFEPLDFDRHCDSCHLTAGIATPALPLRDGDAPGIETVDTILARGTPGSRWALFSNPNEFRTRGDTIVKRPVHHRDPWIEENLRSLRRLLFDDAGLADLLATSPDAPPNELRAMYAEAVATLEGQALELRSSPDAAVQAELGKIDTALRDLRRRLDDPYAPLDESRFLLALGNPRTDLAPAEKTAIDELVAELTTPCRQCHVVENATITRVQSDQRVLRRAEFDHRAHIVQRRCLDCHTEIPMSAALSSADEIPPDLDHAGIQNLPGIDTCRECHTEALAAQACTTCHLFHPDESRRSELLLYLN